MPKVYQNAVPRPPFPPLSPPPRPPMRTLSTSWKYKNNLHFGNKPSPNYIAEISFGDKHSCLRRGDTKYLPLGDDPDSVYAAEIEKTYLSEITQTLSASWR